MNDDSIFGATIFSINKWQLRFYIGFCMGFGFLLFPALNQYDAVCGPFYLILKRMEEE
jgi:hypothetical protein